MTNRVQGGDGGKSQGEDRREQEEPGGTRTPAMMAALS